MDPTLLAPLLFTLGLILGLLGGVVAGAWLARARARAEAQAADAESRAARGALEAELKAVRQAATDAVEAERAASERAQTTAQASAKAAFSELAGQALAANAEAFGRELRQLADAAAERHKAEADKALAARAQAVGELVAPLKTSLGQLQQRTAELERQRAEAYGALKRDLGALREQTRALHEVTGQLGSALRGSPVERGRWGHLSLKNLVERAGLEAHVDFEEEVTLASGAGGKRVDLLVRLPGGGGIPVDAKVPMDAWWQAQDATEPATRDAALAAHAKATRAHIDALGKRDYSGLIDAPVDYTVMYLPGDALLAAALRADPELQDRAIARGVLLASPMTLLALLRTVALYWRQQRLAEDARALVAQAKELHERTATFTGHLAKVGTSLGRATKAWDAAVGSYERRVLPAGRRLSELLGDGAALADLSSAGAPPRRLPEGPVDLRLSETDPDPA